MVECSELERGICNQKVLPLGLCDVTQRQDKTVSLVWLMFVCMELDTGGSSRRDEYQL